MPPENSEKSSDTEADPDAWVDRYADTLYRFALAKTSRTDVAEDLVQETFIAAVRNAHSFRGESTRQTWLFAILRRRIADHFRRAGRQPKPLESTDPSAAGLVSPRSWRQDPAKLCEDAEFLATLASCVAKLPPHLAEAFILRHQKERTPAEIRELLGISPTNLSMRLHRARLVIRDCLDVNWFGQGDSASSE